MFTIAGCAINWKATLQTTVALSTTKAEYIAITETSKEAIWLKGLFGEFIKDLLNTIIFYDSQIAISLINDQVFNERMKHVNGIILYMKLLPVVILL